MKIRKFLRPLILLTTLAGIVCSGLLIKLQPTKADDSGNSDESKIQQGFNIAPVHLNLTGKNRALVGLGSYIVNAVGECNGCHSAGPATEYAPGGNPYFGQQAIVNQATYLGGGRNFGPFPSATPPGAFPNIVSRNLTPDKTGRPEGGNTLAQFMTIIRTGMDPDLAHPTCTGAPNGHCLPAPFRGDLLQIMPWPAYRDMTDHDLMAIYEYLSAIPCVEGGPGEPPNRCH